METPILNLITDCLVPLVTAVVGWLAGSRKRRNDAFKSMQDSIDILSMENKRLIECEISINPAANISHHKIKSFSSKPKKA